MDKLKMWHIALGYGLVFIGFSYYLNVNIPEYCVSSPPKDMTPAWGNNELYKVLVDQLKSNQSRYANNVWQTLATLMMAIGMVLGSEKFKEIVLAKPNYISAIQLILLGLYGLHAFAYTLYAQENTNLIQHLKNIVMDYSVYFTGYQIGWSQVMLNLTFDLILFILLAYILNYFRYKSEIQ